MDHCRDCESTDGEVLSRRRFVQAVGTIAAAVAALPAVARAEEPAKAPSETLVSCMIH
jgi:hypothetical protein